MSDGAGVRERIGTIAPLEAIRGLAILWVILFHHFVVRAPGFGDPWNAAVAAVAPLRGIASLGYLGVDVFFLLSGFLLLLPHWGERITTRTFPAADFYRRRVHRIVPAYYVHLLLLFVFFLPLLRGGIFYWKADVELYSWNFAALVTFLQYATPVTSTTMGVNGALWTLTLDFFFYALLPLLAPVLVRWPWRTAIAMVAAALAWRALCAQGLEGLVAFQMAVSARWQVGEEEVRRLLATQFPGYLAHFALGAIAGREWLRRRDRAPSPRWRHALSLAAVATIAATYAWFPPGPTRQSWLPVTIALALLVYCIVAGRRPLLEPVLESRFLRFCGRVSFSAYLYHLPLLLLWNAFWSEGGSVFAFPLYLATVLGVAWLSYRLVERPFGAASDRPRVSFPEAALPRPR